MFAEEDAGELNVIAGTATTIVCVPPAATGSVPVLVPAAKLIEEKAVVAKLIVLPFVAPDAISAVTKI